jgi:UDPglucose 6-dehydrogenase
MGPGAAPMKVCVAGLWHLGTVTAACLASAGHRVVGFDFDESVIKELRLGHPPLFEPGLEELIQEGLKTGNLRFSNDPDDALKDAEIVWVTYDTPVNEDDVADPEFVVERICKLFPAISSGALVLISSQIPVGTTHRLEDAYTAAYPDRKLSFAYSPENLRLGKAIAVFSDPDRVVVGLRKNDSRSVEDEKRISRLLQPFTQRIEWMSIESAEMTKHALNAFLATSVVFINEIAGICEQVGADAAEVQRGLKSESRIGPKAYLNPGAAFAGGTLARDLAFLEQLGTKHQVNASLISAAGGSNREHRHWARRKLKESLGNWKSKTIGVWGLTYKPGTDTLRRSDAVDLCCWLASQQLRVRAYDPAIKTLPADLMTEFELCSSPIAAIENAAALVLTTSWPDFRSISADRVVAAMENPLVIDPNRFLEETLGMDPRINYVTVGKGEPVSERRKVARVETK